jgi:hypothetical protein
VLTRQCARFFFLTALGRIENKKSQKTESIKAKKNPGRSFAIHAWRILCDMAGKIQKHIHTTIFMYELRQKCGCCCLYCVCPMGVLYGLMDDIQFKTANMDAYCPGWSRGWSKEKTKHKKEEEARRPASGQSAPGQQPAPGVPTSIVHRRSQPQEYLPGAWGVKR